MIDKNRKAKVIGLKGERNKLAKLTNKKVLSIRSKYKKGNTSLQKLANKYKVSFQLISMVVNRKIWKHI